MPVFDHYSFWSLVWMEQSVSPTVVLPDLGSSNEQGLWSQELGLIAADQVMSDIKCWPAPPNGPP